MQLKIFMQNDVIHAQSKEALCQGVQLQHLANVLILCDPRGIFRKDAN